jgi:hypothetical protein
MRMPIRMNRALPFLTVLLVAGAAQAQIRVVNMIPLTLSNETNRDSEPSVAVNPARPQNIAASAFTPDPMSGGVGPVFVSTDGGATWVLNMMLPGGNRTGDTSIRFGGSSDVLYGGILRFDNSNLNILRKANFAAPGAMSILVDRASDDQPWVEAATTGGGTASAKDRVFIGNNDFTVVTSPRRTATVDLSNDAATAPAPAGFAPARVESRSTGTPNQDGPSVRTAHHPDGTVYAAFYGWRTTSGALRLSDIVVVRDDAWASGATPFTALVDADALAGKRIVTGQNINFAASLGHQRIGSQIAIAVDPANSSIVYVAWGEGSTGAGYTLHLRRSTDRGVTWSADLRTVAGATNPGLAVTTAGRVGFLYQRLVNSGGGDRWETHVERSSNGFVSSFTDLILANVPDNLGSYAGPNPIGDYANLMAVGKNFYGAFSGFNTPDMANFPNGVTYQRNANFATHQLLGTDGTTVVGDSIDPYFFSIQEGPSADSDFYVRDWTDSASSGDSGVEPSTHAYFFTTSDVWNRRGTLPGPFPSDQPSNEDAGNGAGSIGDNWAFTRIRRNALPASGSKTVTARFLVSKFGTGSNYVDASSVDPDVSFPDPDPTVNFTASDLGPFITPAYHWHLNAISSTHLCVAVEISSPGDPVVAPGLLGHAPGWPTTDLSVIYDNNKAQRNMGLSTTPARGVGFSGMEYGLLHNAATVRRDMLLTYQVDAVTLRRLQGATLEVVGGKEPQRIALEASGKLVVPAMDPGENRWVGLRFSSPEGKPGEQLLIPFVERVNGTPIDGFSLGVKLAEDSDALVAAIESHRSVFTRLAYGWEVSWAKDEAASAQRLLDTGKVDVGVYTEWLKAHLPALREAAAMLVKLDQGQDPFELEKAYAALESVMGQGSGVGVVHQLLLSKMDTHQTKLQLAKGDVADLLQMVSLQSRLYASERLQALACRKDTLSILSSFARGFSARKLKVKDYPPMLEKLLGCFSETAKLLQDSELAALADQLQGSLADPVAAEGAHRAFLMRLSALL